MSLRVVGFVSAAYDFALAAAMLAAPVAVARAFGAPDPVPVVNAQINGVFALALAAGYVWALRDLPTRRGYFWGAGVLAKGLGAAVFVIDHFLRASPASYLGFAATDGLLAVATLWALRRSPA
jgi:hypothetical protein